jgi:tRNA A-37 threonylcarbamoyl transferase component Bud32
MYKIIALLRVPPALPKTVNLTCEEILDLLYRDLDDEACVIVRSSKGGGGGQTLLFDSVVLKNPGKLNELKAAKLYHLLCEDIPTTYLIRDENLNLLITSKLENVENSVPIPADQDLLLMARVQGKNLSEYLKKLPPELMQEELSFVGSELGRIAVKDIITGNWDRVILLTDESRLQSYVNFGNVMVQTMAGVRKKDVPMIVIDNAIHSKPEKHAKSVGLWIAQLPFEIEDAAHEIARIVQESIQTEIGHKFILDESVYSAIIEGFLKAFSELPKVLESITCCASEDQLLIGDINEGLIDLIGFLEESRR